MKNSVVIKILLCFDDSAEMHNRLRIMPLYPACPTSRAITWQEKNPTKFCRVTIWNNQNNIQFLIRSIRADSSQQYNTDFKIRGTRLYSVYQWALPGPGY
ncbi:MAG TPA: hypothetical protein VLA49_20130 [Anaerolineales bacterium]|nr:hypothetical protein [Anaerolineales bacterium]